MTTPTGKYTLQYHDYEKGEMKMVNFEGRVARIWFLVTRAPKAVMEGRFRLIDIVD